MKAWTLLLSTFKCLPIAYFKRAVSKTVPEPITFCSGNPLNFAAVNVRISTGFETTRSMPSYNLFAISGIIFLNVLIFFFY